MELWGLIEAVDREQIKAADPFYLSAAVAEGSGKIDSSSNEVV